jgi:hypothetical protein
MPDSWSIREDLGALYMSLKRLLGIGKEPSSTELLIRAAVLLVVKEVRKTEARIMATLDDVIAKVADQSSVVASAASLIDGLQDKLEAALKEVKAGADPEKLKAIVAALEADKGKLVEAMKENTVAELEPEVPVEPAPAPAPEPIVEAAPAEPAPEAPVEAPTSFDQWGNPV